MKIQKRESAKPFITLDGSLIREIVHPNSSGGRVKKRPYGLPLLIKPLVRISRKRLSFGIVPL